LKNEVIAMKEESEALKKQQQTMGQVNIAQ